MHVRAYMVDEYVDGWLQASTAVPGKISDAPLVVFSFEMAPLVVGGLTVADRVWLRLVEVTRQFVPCGTTSRSRSGRLRWNRG